MTPTDIATIIAAYTGVAVVLAGIVARLFKAAVKSALVANKEQMKAEMDDPISELRHNGGSSLLDVVKLQILPTVLELRDNQILIKEKVDRLEGRFEQHVEEHQA
jgi:hypothetical protein